MTRSPLSKAAGGLRKIVLVGLRMAISEACWLQRSFLKCSQSESLRLFLNITVETLVRIPEHAPTYSDNMRPPVPGYPPTGDALP